MIAKRFKYSPCNAAAIPDRMQAENIPYIKIETADWPAEFPYIPDTELAIAHDSENIYIHYHVSEGSVKADFGQDFGNVWEDSCCEFFCEPCGDGKYYNFECNCIGAMYLCCGKDRHSREPAPKEVMASIERWTSLGTEPLGLIGEPRKYDIALKIPATAFFRHNVESLDALQARCNVYKCGETLDNHFVSLYPIDTPAPDFHRPEFFGEIIFE